MKTILTIAAILFAFAAHAQTAAEKEILDLSKAKFRWQIERKVDSLADMFDDNLVFVHSNGMTSDKQKTLDGLRNGFPIYNTTDVKEASVRFFGKTAVLIGQAYFELTMNNARSSYNLVYTEVYQKTGKKWKLIVRQAASLPPSPTK
ncbi:nuclear transport factor 2 family protein [Mucilaginibacter pedocola]|uniref:DUF4440 domain-containing protein n=1 Tax=Mucilaginibacter pedocola TaxID=1792845 RepID=A0A1S9PM30_9SPHI|nr:nuclear transport factor 2 family protein [Mucilaginibacter pedocola]OOQ61618.1 hypothetical protein BC343_00650 [Mucilaginibacter pedocola]